ncbi:CRP-like cAMP-binding protein [Algoriphagus boseongensis]|uniref:CRP-like cAMP-binding protein n=1 Tax=Algoriphagus boseongensis TaxID=1442587 RepID=A0A4V3D1Y1_9BACT|nr:Crp/Fnr family transcriptional regulator [Algoriphagus boseongensis]TDQ15019.1 CRP-like cAMP-binding protein [Algoriphagus boseongensis]
MEQILDRLNRFSGVEEKAKLAFAESLELVQVERGDLLEKMDSVCSHLYFVIEGSLRSFYFKDNKDITVSFALEGEFTTSMYSFISRQPGYENIEAMESSSVGKISHARLLELFEKHPSLERAYRIILEHYYIALEEQLIFTKFKSARDRYLSLMETRPRIIHKASVGQIASFLDMSIETLSRIRGKI